MYIAFEKVLMKKIELLRFFCIDIIAHTHTKKNFFSHTHKMIHFTTELECIYALVRAAVLDMDYGMVHISSHAGTYHPCGYAERGNAAMIITGVNLRLFF